MPLSSHIYDRDYFLSDRCEGFDRFREGHGLSPIKAAQVRALAPRPGIRVLDAGCGRGEVLLACARAGAQVAGSTTPTPRTRSPARCWRGYPMRTCARAM